MWNKKTFKIWVVLLRVKIGMNWLKERKLYGWWKKKWLGQTTRDCVNRKMLFAFYFYIKGFYWSKEHNKSIKAWNVANK